MFGRSVIEKVDGTGILLCVAFLSLKCFLTIQGRVKKDLNIGARASRARPEMERRIHDSSVYSCLFRKD